MLRLTLRSARDGRLLARIVEREGVAFVLDYGDPAVVADASRKLLHGGFTASWGGALETAAPGTPALVRQLALHYVEQGLLVVVDEPDFPRREGISPVDVPSPLSEGPPTLLPDDWSEGGDTDTEILSRRDLVRLKARLEAERVVRERWKPPPLEPLTLPEADEDDEPTEEIDPARRKR